MSCMRIQQPRSLRRLNFVGQKQDREKLRARVQKFADLTEASHDAIETILSMIESAIPDQVGTLRSNAAIASQNHNEGDDAKT